MNQSYSGSGGGGDGGRGGGGGGGGGEGGGPVVQEAIQEINYAINITYVDDRDVIISDDDTNVVIGAGEIPAPEGEEGMPPEGEVPPEGGPEMVNEDPME